MRYRRDPHVRIHAIDSRSLLVEGSRDPRDSFIEVSGETIATVRISAGSLLEGRPERPYLLHLRRPPVISGSTIDAGGHPASETHVSLFELIGRDRSSQATPAGTLKRRWISETLSDETGHFMFTGPSAGVYEFLVLHPTRGRAAVVHRVDHGPLTISLEATARVRGRVLHRYAPVIGAAVRMVPDETDLATVKDPLTILGSGGFTDGSGQFEVSLPPQGSGTLVIGGGSVGTIRHRYRHADTLPPMTDLGDLELPPSIELRVRLEQSDCELHSVGPLGSLGMNRVRAVYNPIQGTHEFRLPERGVWWLEAVCERTGVLSFPQSSDFLTLERCWSSMPGSFR